MIRAMTEIELPATALVVLVGVSGAGKTTFAARHFRPTQVLSSDAFRAIVADDAADQRATRAAFELLHLAARRRLERGRLTVIDATNVTRAARVQLIGLAERTGRPAIAIVLDPPTEVAVARNASRDGRTVAAPVVERQAAELASWVGGGRALEGEGFAAVHRLPDPDASVTIVIAGGGPRRSDGKPPGAGTMGRAPNARRRTRRSAR